MPVVPAPTAPAADDSVVDDSVVDDSAGASTDAAGKVSPCAGTPEAVAAEGVRPVSPSLSEPGW
ncbi:hypothetical protein GCM10022247_60460 [Allokutzneria multivorans]|uniref:Uncharacterized protein n=1 Tax=Allokutzneria multivorans TaxID=1142134 RepID=A0ABP7TKF7_9PSEU